MHVTIQFGNFKKKGKPNNIIKTSPNTKSFKRYTKPIYYVFYIGPTFLGFLPLERYDFGIVKNRVL